MKVRMKVGIQGTRDGRRWPGVGGEVELPHAEGARLCAAGLATPVAEPAPVEKAVAPKVEKRAPRRKSQD